MADNVVINPATGVAEATTLAYDDAGADGKVGLVKLAISADGSATRVPADAANGLDVDVTRLPGTVAADVAAIAGKDFATQTTLTAILAKLIAAPATEATLVSVLASVDGLETLLAHGTFAYATGTTAATVDVPAGARARLVSVIAGGGAATIAIAGGAAISVPAGAALDVPITGDVATGADVVIGGTPASYVVTWTT
jgi:hypothetical protein